MRLIAAAGVLSVCAAFVGLEHEVWLLWGLFAQVALFSSLVAAHDRAANVNGRMAAIRAAVLVASGVMIGATCVSLFLPTSMELFRRGVDTSLVPVWSVGRGLNWSVLTGLFGGSLAFLVHAMLPSAITGTVRRNLKMAALAFAVISVAGTVMVGVEWVKASVASLDSLHLPDRPPRGWWAVPNDYNDKEVTLCRWGLVSRSPRMEFHLDQYPQASPTPAGGVMAAAEYLPDITFYVWNIDRRRGFLVPSTRVWVDVFAPLGDTQVREAGDEAARWLGLQRAAED